MPISPSRLACLAAAALAACGDPADANLAVQSSALTSGAQSELDRSGIYGVEGGSSCISTPIGPVCPLGFESVSGRARLLAAMGDTGSQVSATLSAEVDGVPVMLTSISSQFGVPVARYTDRVGTARSLTGASLSRLLLHLSLGGAAVDLLLVGPSGPATVAGLFESPVVFRIAGGPWSALCRDENGAQTMSAFVDGARFDPMTAQRTESSASVAMACKKGGIVSCMEWGYQPWKSATNLQTGQKQSLGKAHVACIQMKRAAYCGTANHTEPGTAIFMSDVFGIHNEAPAGGGADAGSGGSIGSFEAVWDENGAVCVNPNGEHRDYDAPEAPSCPWGALPSCDTYGDGGLIISATPGALP